MATNRLQILSRHLGSRQDGCSMSLGMQFSPTQMTSVIPGSGLFKYTVDNSLLTVEQRHFYEENGFIVIPKLVSDQLVDQFRLQFLNIVDGRIDRNQILMMKDISLRNKVGVSNERLVNKIQDFVWDDVLSQHCMLPQVLDYVSCFIGPNVMAMHTMLINKPPDPGTKTSRHPLHQDLHYFPFRPADRIVCAWTAMEDITTSNGCLVVIPGTHKGVLLQHNYPEWEDGVNKMYHGIRGYENVPYKHVEMSRGDTVFFHPLLIHGSGTNRTNGFRKAISCHYAASECEYIDVRGTTQANIAEEVVEIAKRRGIEDIDFRDVWKFRSRCVQGQEVNL